MPYIVELRKRLKAAPRGKASIGGCDTWEQFCEKHLHRTASAIRKTLQTKHDGSAHRKPKEEGLPDWSYKENYLDSNAATKLYQTMVNLPEWQSHRTDGSTASAIYYGLSYTSEGGGARNNEIPEISSFLKSLANKISAKVGIPVNYIQCHKCNICRSFPD